MPPKSFAQHLSELADALAALNQARALLAQKQLQEQVQRHNELAAAHETMALIQRVRSAR